MPRYDGAGSVMNKVIKNIFNKSELKSRLPYALLGGFTPSFMFLFFGILDIFSGNRDEFMFAASDFTLYIALIALGASVVISALIMFMPEPVSVAVFGISVWFSVMGYIQVLFLNGPRSLGGDTGQKTDTVLAVVDAIVWVIVGFIILFGAFMMKKKGILKKIYLIALVVILVMNITGCVTQIGTITSEPGEKTSEESTSNVNTDETTNGKDTIPGLDTPDDTTEEQTTEPDTSAEDITVPDTSDPDETTEAATNPPDTKEDTTKAETTAPTTSSSGTGDSSKIYLTKAGLDQVSTGKNIVIFIVDRFDVSYYNDLIKKTPDFFDDLDGFTYFSDNISLYSRTWPAVPTMITGIDNDFRQTASTYFKKAYTESPFLNDLKNNGYQIKLYTQSYYCYRDGAPLVGVADNISTSKGYTITNTGALIGNLVKLSAYRYAPNALKDSIDITSASFSGIVQMKGTAPMYEMNDPEVCGQILQNGLSFDSDGNSYIFIHLNGGHSPYNMDANAQKSNDASADSQIRGCFKMIKFYLDEMKKLDVYDDATIVITGDHPRARDDEAIPTQPRITALFVKPTGSRGALKYSTAQVSQDNLIPTLVKSAGIKTELYYGQSYFEIEEGVDTERYHKFELSGEKKNQIVTFKVKGKGSDFKNWQIVETTDLPGSFYR